jgi:hypothetical protein
LRELAQQAQLRLISIETTLGETTHALPKPVWALLSSDVQSSDRWL